MNRLCLNCKNSDICKFKNVYDNIFKNCESGYDPTICSAIKEIISCKHFVADKSINKYQE